MKVFILVGSFYLLYANNKKSFISKKKIVANSSGGYNLCLVGFSMIFIFEKKKRRVVV